METDASFLKKALLKSGLCKEAEASLDVEMSEVPFTLVCKGCSEGGAEAIEALVLKTLEEAASHSFPSDRIEAALHGIEFDRLEIGGEGIPFGLDLFFRSGLMKQHGVDATSALLVYSLFKDLRNRLQDNAYLPDLIRTYFLENPHYVVVTLKPDPQLENKESKEEKVKLDAIRDRMSLKEAEAIVQQSKKLAAFQKMQEDQSLDCLPKVTLEDVSPKPIDFPLHESSEGRLNVFHTPCFTNHILYADLIFDLQTFSAEELPYLSLYTRLFTELGCGGRTYAENLERLEAYTGGASASLNLYSLFEDPDVCKPAFSIRIKALERHTEQLFDLLGDFAQGVDLSDESRISEWIQQHATQLQNRLSKHAMAYATQMAFSHLSPASFIYNEWHGLPYYQAVLKWAASSDWIQKLKTIQEKLLTTPTADLVLSSDALPQKQIRKLSKRLLNARHSAPWNGNYPRTSIESQARIIGSPVAFTTQALRTCSYKHPDAAYLLLACELLDNVVLHSEIREQGGAYGSGATYAPSIGNFNLYSYRDPNLSKTLISFQRALETIASGDFDEEDLEEAKFGVIQTLDTPVIPGNRAITAYSWKRSGRTLSLRRTFRNLILQAAASDVAAAVKNRLLNQETTIISFLGQELYDKEKEKLTLPLPAYSLPSN